MRVASGKTVESVARVAAAIPLLLYGLSGDYEQPNLLHFAALIAGAIALAGAMSGTWWSGWLALAASIDIGVHERVALPAPNGSDVMLSTREALAVLGEGLNPYTHIYIHTNPPGSVFAYLPGELAFYGLWHLGGGDVLRADRYAGIGVLLLLVLLTPVCGENLIAFVVGVCAFSSNLIFRAVDGSNDTAASFVMLGAVVALGLALTRRGRGASVAWWTAAALAGWSIAFKAYSIPVVLFLALYLMRTQGRRARAWIAGVLALAAAFIVPFFVWNPAGFIANIGGELVVHKNIWGRNVWHDVVANAPDVAAGIAPFVPIVALASLIAVCVVMWRRPATTLGGALLQGCAAVGTVFVFARWTTSVYYVFLVPLVLAGVVLVLTPAATEPSDKADVRAAGYISD